MTDDFHSFNTRHEMDFGWFERNKCDTPNPRQCAPNKLHLKMLRFKPCLSWSRGGTRHPKSPQMLGAFSGAIQSFRTDRLTYLLTDCLLTYWPTEQRVWKLMACRVLCLSLRRQRLTKRLPVSTDLLSDSEYLVQTHPDIGWGWISVRFRSALISMASIEFT